MKRGLALLSVVLLALSLFGCADSPDVSDVSVDSTTTEKTTSTMTESTTTATTTTSTPFPGISTREEHPTTAPGRTPNAAGVVNIVDWTEILSIGVGQAFQTFYEDGDYEYQFNTWKKEYVLVHYADGSEKAVDAALADGDITLADLDSYGITYRKRPKETTTTTTKESTTTTTEKPTTTTTTTAPTTTTMKFTYVTLKNTTTSPPRTPNAKGVVNIVEVNGGRYGTYSDENFIYYFGSTCVVVVFYADGSEKSLPQAFIDGDVTLADLDSYGIEYRKRSNKTTTALGRITTARRDTPNISVSEIEFRLTVEASARLYA